MEQVRAVSWEKGAEQEVFGAKAWVTQGHFEVERGCCSGIGYVTNSGIVRFGAAGEVQLRGQVRSQV